MISKYTALCRKYLIVLSSNMRSNLKLYDGNYLIINFITLNRTVNLETAIIALFNYESWQKSFRRPFIINKQGFYKKDSIKDTDKTTTIKIILMTLDVAYWLLNPKTTKQSGYRCMVGNVRYINLWKLKLIVR